jgi:hypothetical protein
MRGGHKLVATIAGARTVRTTWPCSSEPRWRWPIRIGQLFTCPPEPSTAAVSASFRSSSYWATHCATAWRPRNSRLGTFLRLDDQAGRGQADIRLDDVLRAVRRRHRGRFLAKVRLAFAVTAVTAV